MKHGAITTCHTHELYSDSLTYLGVRRPTSSRKASRACARCVRNVAGRPTYTKRLTTPSTYNGRHINVSYIQSVRPPNPLCTCWGLLRCRAERALAMCCVCIVRCPDSGYRVCTDLLRWHRPGLVIGYVRHVSAHIDYIATM